MKTTYATIKDVRFGKPLDTDKIGLLFVTSIDDNTSAIQFIPVDALILIIKAHNITDINKLNGEPCLVETDNVSYIKFIQLVKFY